MMDDVRKQRQVDKVLAAFENQQIGTIADPPADARVRGLGMYSSASS